MEEEYFTCDLLSYVFDSPPQMFGCCGNSAKYNEGDLDDEMKRLADLLKPEEEDKKEDDHFDIITPNKIYRKIL